jgi:hypothetical protein
MYFFERYTSELSSFLLESSTLPPKYPNNKNDVNNKTKFLSIAIKVKYKVICLSCQKSFFIPLEEVLTSFFKNLYVFKKEETYL